MGTLLFKLTAWLGGGLFAMFGAWKVFLVGGFLAFLMVNVYNLVSEIILELLTFVSDQIAALTVPGSVGPIYQFTGLAGWFMVQFQVPQCVAFIVSVVLLKWTLRKIPFLRW